MLTPDIEPLLADPAARLPFRIGIVGGMGPMAGVYLQQLIIEATPAGRDQDHFQAVCFTNPHVPERMQSLAQDGGRRYAEAVRASAILVARAGATHLVVPCNTAHARLAEIQRGVDVPFVDMIELGVRELVSLHGTGRARRPAGDGGHDCRACLSEGAARGGTRLAAAGRRETRAGYPPRSSPSR